jgi:hypothetical protein
MARPRTTLMAYNVARQGLIVEISGGGTSLTEAGQIARFQKEERC